MPEARGMALFFLAPKYGKVVKNLKLFEPLQMIRYEMILC